MGSVCSLGSCPLADLTVDPVRLANSWFVHNDTIAAGDCQLSPEEGSCAGGVGARRLLRFQTRVPNVGSGDLYLGLPADYPEVFVFSACHGHAHLESFARYQPLDAQGCEVAAGAKRGFCSEDVICPPSIAKKYVDCGGIQGITAGCIDLYHTMLPCQFVDVTGVAPGSYTLRVTVHFARLLAESDYSNNVAEAPVVVP